jgi:NAD(P)-dependent dehydrogenase (short-subunit alcohol dehydrogenase family)
MSPHHGKRALVTGGASGIGFAIARRLINEGAEVIVVDRNETGLGPVAALGAKTVAVDLASAEGRAQLLKSVDALDYLVNSAGIIELSSIWDVKPGQWQRTFSVNAEAVFFLCQIFGRQIRPGGAIVNLSSAAAKQGTAHEGAVYAASKAAVISMTRSFAFALADRPVRVNAVCPGIIDTPMQQTVVSAMAPLRGQTELENVTARLKAIPLGRMATPEECAAVVCFLLSADASYMTAQAVNVTGGTVTW